MFLLFCLVFAVLLCERVVPVLLLGICCASV